jgi:predicted ATPase
MQAAKQLYSLSKGQNDSAQMIAAYRALAGTHHFLGDFESARKYAISGIEIWRSGSLQSREEDLDASAVVCLCYKALSEWHFGEISFAHANIAEAILLAKELNDSHALAGALHFTAILRHLERNTAEVERLVSELIELSTRHNFALWLAGGKIFGGWARSVSGSKAEGIAWIEDGIRDYRAAGSMLRMPYYLAMKAEALYLANHTPEALETIREAEGVVERFEERGSCAELHRLRGVFLVAMRAEEPKLRLHFAQPSESHGSRNRLHWRSARKQLMQNTAAEEERLKGVTLSEDCFAKLQLCRASRGARRKHAAVRSLLSDFVHLRMEF